MYIQTQKQVMLKCLHSRICFVACLSIIADTCNFVEFVCYQRRQSLMKGNIEINACVEDYTIT